MPAAVTSRAHSRAMQTTPPKPPQTKMQKLDTATKALGWISVVLFVAAIVTAFFCPLAAGLLFGLALATSFASGGCFIAKIVEHVKNCLQGGNEKAVEFSSNVQDRLAHLHQGELV